MSIFVFYGFAFVVSALSASTLSIVGKHTRARGTILEVFFLAQLGLFGGLVSKIAFPHHAPIALTLVFVAFSYVAGKVLLQRARSYQLDMDLLMIGGYLVLLSLQYLMVGLFPQLDSHMTSNFFGSVVTADMLECVLLLVCYVLTAILFRSFSRRISRNTVESSIFGNQRRLDLDFLILSFPVVMSLYSLGFLYTMSFLLLPTLIVGRLFSSERVAAYVFVVISCVGSVMGLYFSIAFESVSTASMQVFTLFLILVLTLAALLSLRRFRFKKKS